MRRAIEIAKFMSDAEGVYARKNAKNGARVYSLTSDSGRKRVGTLAEVVSQATPYPVWKGRRLFNGWTMSSADRSGERLCN